MATGVGRYMPAYAGIKAGEINLSPPAADTWPTSAATGRACLPSMVSECLVACLLAKPHWYNPM